LGYETDIAAFFGELHTSFPESSSDSLKETGLTPLIEQARLFCLNGSNSAAKNTHSIQFEQIKQAESSGINRLLETRAFLNQLTSLPRQIPNYKILQMKISNTSLQPSAKCRMNSIIV